MRYPKFLEAGGRIGFIAPSFGCAAEPYCSDFEEALKWFKDKGYTTVLGPNCFLGEGTGISSTPQNCAAEANDFFINDRSDVIISCGGGELMCHILPYVDFERIASSVPKWFMGYSDNTNLTFTLNTLCDTASIYSVCAPKFNNRRHRCVDDAFDILCGRRLRVSNYDMWYKEIWDEQCAEAADTPDGTDEADDKAVPETYLDEKTGKLFELYPYRQYIYNGDEPASEASFSGRLIGGCMDCLVTLTGTGFDAAERFAERYAGDGIIWFLESCDLSSMSVRRALWQMENAGWFKNVKGFLIGRPLHYDDEFDGFGQRDAVLGILGKYNVPLILDLDIGHMFPQMPLISGSYARVNAKDNSIGIEHVLR